MKGVERIWTIVWTRVTLLSQGCKFSMTIVEAGRGGNYGAKVVTSAQGAGPPGSQWAPAPSPAELIARAAPARLFAAGRTRGRAAVPRAGGGTDRLPRPHRRSV